MSFKCTNCDKEFKAKQNLNYHIENNTCKKAFSCQYCNKGFTTKANMGTHIRTTCEVKKKNDKEKDDIYKKLLKMEEEHKQLQKMILEKDKKLQDMMSEKNKKFQDSVLEKNKKLQEMILERDKKLQEMILERDKKSDDQINALKSKITTIEKNTKKSIKNVNNGAVNNGTINNGDNNYNIILVGYGKEDLSKIDKKEILKAMQHGYDSTLKLTEALHFNPKHPEYNNIYITNMKDKYAMMFDGKDWNLTMKDDLINKIYDDKKSYIEENIDDFVDSLSASRKKALERWLATEDNNERIIKVKEEMKLLLYNKRNIVLDKEIKIKKKSKRTKKESSESDDQSNDDE
jgi:hypothetical protein